MPVLLLWTVLFRQVWLDPTKLIMKQVRRKYTPSALCCVSRSEDLGVFEPVCLCLLSTGPMNTLFRLSVKFFPPDPGQLQEEFSRWDVQKSPSIHTLYTDKLNSACNYLPFFSQVLVFSANQEGSNRWPTELYRKHCRLACLSFGAMYVI